MEHCNAMHMALTCKFISIKSLMSYAAISLFYTIDNIINFLILALAFILFSENPIKNANNKFNHVSSMKTYTHARKF